MNNSNRQESQTASPSLPSRKPANSESYELTPSEIVSLRQDSIESSKRMCAMLGLDYKAAVV